MKPLPGAGLESDEMVGGSGVKPVVDPNDDYFSDGMTDDLITDLSEPAGLFVISVNSTLR